MVGRKSAATQATAGCGSVDHRFNSWRSSDSTSAEFSSDLLEAAGGDQ